MNERVAMNKQTVEIMPNSATDLQQQSDGQLSDSRVDRQIGAVQAIKSSSWHDKDK